MNTTDTDLNDLFRSATDDLGFETGNVVAAGTARGRRLRRRSAAVRIVGSVAAVAVVAPLGWLALSNQGTDAPTATTPADRVAAGTDQIPAVAASEVIPTLAGLVEEIAPDLETSPSNDSEIHEIPVPGVRMGTLTTSDSQGSGYVTLRISPAQPAASHERTVANVCSDLLPGMVTYTCTEVAEGTLATRTRSHELPRSATTAEAMLVTREGLVVIAHSHNYNHRRATRPTPPLDVEQLSALVTADAWITQGDAAAFLEEYPLGTLAFDAAGAGAELATMIEEAVPGVTITELDAATFAAAYSHDVYFTSYTRKGLLVDDGGGVSYVEVLLESAPYNFTVENPPACPASSCRQDEGGRLDTQELASDKDGSVITYNRASYQRADGVGVTVRSTTAAGPETPGSTPTRDAPLLSVEQLSAIATSDVWVN
ncbi:hypothetical protein [Nocardioides jishulii]|uniref:Uncharacterized protein n=1 Tax=Nocardioides jishulii TaxID=2575440 RepID=A0A4U2YVB8_9ACTN|nr:hypothetical protein [Nocardioides jishulii]QCX26130.1 hypothetical protein FCL41_00170 [Nocardioides jishulii]TKI64071.1 hypothetical protein FC770_02540 [Nocardioides jishulii]